LNFALVKSAYALGLPNYEIKSNENGYFEFSLPAVAPSFNRVYVSALFSLPIPGMEKPFSSPKSNTLSFSSLGLGELLLLFLSFFFKEAEKILGHSRKDPIYIILGEILVLFFLAALLLSQKEAKKQRAKRAKDIIEKER